eukprot:2468527-Amphidinium_carterae.2
MVLVVGSALSANGWCVSIGYKSHPSIRCAECKVLIHGLRSMVVLVLPTVSYTHLRAHETEADL